MQYRNDLSFETELVRTLVDNNVNRVQVNRHTKANTKREQKTTKA